jgi:glutathione S-transferase
MDTEQQQDPNLVPIFVPDATTPRPALNPAYPRLYGHHNCPFVEKVRLAFAARNHVYQSCEVDLGEKTQWHLDLNGGKVPIYELPDGTLIFESKILMEYAEEAFPDQGYSLLPKSPVERA